MNAAKSSSCLFIYQIFYVSSLMFIRDSLVFSLNGLFKMVIVISGEIFYVLYRYATNTSSQKLKLCTFTQQWNHHILFVFEVFKYILYFKMIKIHRRNLIVKL